MKLLFALLIVAALTEAIGVFYLFQKKSTIPLFFVYTLAEGFFLVPMYYFKGETRLFKLSVLFGFLCFLILLVFKLIFQWTNEVLNTVIALQVLLYSSVMLYRMQNQSNKKDLLASAFFWINLGFFMYYGSSMFFLMFENKVRYAPSYIRSFITSTHMIINTCCNLLLSFGLCKIKRN